MTKCTLSWLTTLDCTSKFDLSENTLVQVIKRPHTLLVELIRIGTGFYIAHQFHIKCLENIDIDSHEYCTLFNYIPHMFGSWEVGR